MSTRREFIAMAAITLGTSALEGQDVGLRKWYITGGHRATQSDWDVEPIECYGKDRLDAVAHSGITVWSEDEWREAKDAMNKIKERK